MTWWRISRRVRGCARTVRGVLQSKSQEGGLFFEREQEREKGDDLGRVGEEKESCFVFIPRPGSHRRAAPVDSPRRPCGQSARRADGPTPQRGRSVITSRTSRAAPLLHEPRGRSAPPWRTVRQEQPDSLAHCHGRSDLSF
jgi:hypothetical protein